MDYEEGAKRVSDAMTTGYPRFFVHKSIQAFAADIAQKHGQPGQQAMLFPSQASAQRCVAFIKEKAPTPLLENLSLVHLALDPSKPSSGLLKPVNPTISAVLFVPEAFPYAKQYWQHSGDGVSSRRAEFCHDLFTQGLLIANDSPKSSPPTSPLRQMQCKGPRRYQRPMSADNNATTSFSNPAKANGSAAAKDDGEESSRFVEERFGRNLDISLANRAKIAIKRRIAGTLTTSVDVDRNPLPKAELSSRGVHELSENDIYLYPMGMNAIFNTHRFLLSCRGGYKSISFGFPYVDTLKVLQKFGPGCIHYGRASEEDLNALEQRLESGEKFLGLFCEFPGNPMLTCPNLVRLRALADKYDFALVIDETIGTFANINVLQYADVVVSSLTKIFSGDCNVMGGAAVLNPNSRYYDALKAVVAREYEDTYWPEDVIFLERNSRDFKVRVDRINVNAEAICEVLLADQRIKTVHYPKHNPDRANYEACKLPDGGYGGLLSVVFHEKADAVVFYDSLETAKGPSLGTNFTLTSPYVVLAHYAELDWAASLGVDPDLIRISVGLEETEDILEVFKSALCEVEHARQENEQ